MNDRPHKIVESGSRLPCSNVVRATCAHFLCDSGHPRADKCIPSWHLELGSRSKTRRERSWSKPLDGLTDPLGGLTNPLSNDLKPSKRSERSERSEPPIPSR